MATGTTYNPKSKEEGQHKDQGQGQNQHKDQGQNQNKDQGQNQNKEGFDKIKDAGSQAMDKAKDVGSQAMDKAKDAGSQVMDKAKEAAASVGAFANQAASTVGQKANDLAGTAGADIKKFGDTLSERAPHEGMLGTASQAVADTIKGGGRYLEEAKLSGMADDVTHMIQRHPMPAVLICLGVGFVLGRAFKD